MTRALTQRHTHTLVRLDPRIARRRLAETFGRKGFGRAVVSSVVSEVLRETGSDTDDMPL